MLNDELKASRTQFIVHRSAFIVSPTRSLTLAVLLFCLAVFGCARTRGGGGDVVVKPAQEKVRVGVIMSLTGDTAQYGLSALNGARMAVEEANAAGGVAGRRVELIAQDTRSDGVETEVVVHRLARELNVHALVGEIVSSRSLAAARAAQAEGLPMLTPSATSPEITAQGDFVFRSCYTDAFQGAAMARFAAVTLGARRAALLVAADQRYSQELASFIRGAFERQGGEIVGVQEYREGAADFSAQLLELSASRPDVVFVPGYYLEAGLLARQARALGLEAPFVGGDGWDSPRLYEIGGQALAGDFFSTHFSAEDPDPQVQRFVADYRRLFGSAPDSFAATAYDAARIMLAAVARAPSLERRAIRDALASTKDFPGVTGTVNFNAERNAVKSVVVVRIGENGKQSVESHVAPEDVAAPATPTPSPTPQRGRRRRA
jgi:branched-chain amino acid transport system substrate-binding protein